MSKDLKVIATQLKNMSDANRLAILEMLSCGEMCAQMLLAKLDITQPTLSYHMKFLTTSELVIARREGKNIFYQLNYEVLETLKLQLHELTTPSIACPCKP